MKCQSASTGKADTRGGFVEYDYYDVLTIGMGPAGMAVSAMAAEMGLKVCAIERNKIGGECMNVGCIPSKALLRIAKTRSTFDKLDMMALSSMPKPDLKRPFERIQEHIDYINRNKTMAMFTKVDLLLGKGDATFVDKDTVRVGNRRIKAKRIFICVGTRPAKPPIPGIENVDLLTNENIFHLDKVPDSMTIIGGGAIGCEMAQAFQRLGCRVSIVQMDPYLLPFGEEDAGRLLEDVFTKEGIDVYNSRKITRVEKHADGIALYTSNNEEIVSEKLMVAAGRRMDLSPLNLENAGIEYSKKGIKVNKYLQTTQANIYAPGDCNGNYLLSHAAMHQGMIALMNSLLPSGMKKNFRKFVVPWTVFTEPQVSHVGKLESQLIKEGKKYEVVESRYEDYGAAIAEGVDTGFVKVFVSPMGKIYGAKIVGEGSGEMISEWAMAIQKNIRMHDILFLQHSFPTMSFLNKRVSENWMMNKMKSKMIKRLIKRFARRDLPSLYKGIAAWF